MVAAAANASTVLFMSVVLSGFSRIVQPPGFAMVAVAKLARRLARKFNIDERRSRP
jgi:hypothetical protein